MDIDALSPGFKVEEFRIVRKLGAGGMSVVYLAEDLFLGRSVALKLMRVPEECSTEESRNRLLLRFEREAHVLAVLEHPSILPVYRRGVDSGTGCPFYAMKAILLSETEMRNLCENVFHSPLPRQWGRWAEAPQSLTLSVLLEGGKTLPQEMVARMGAELAEAIACAHRSNPPVVHRDIKPGNILFDVSGRALLCDFGIAGRAHTEEEGRSLDTFDANVTSTSRRGFIGTADYAAPEQRRAAPAIPAMDYYSLAVVLYEALTARLPRSLEMPSTFNPKHISRRWDGLLGKMLIADPENRLTNPEEILGELRSIAYPKRLQLLQGGLAILHVIGAICFLLGMILLFFHRKGFF